VLFVRMAILHTSRLKVSRPVWRICGFHFREHRRMSGVVTNLPLRSFARYLLVVIPCAAGDAAIAATTPDHCVAGEYVIGCQTEKLLDEIGSFHADSEAIRKAIFDSITSGACNVFKDGEPISVIDRTFVSERRLVRRPDEIKAYWMPNRWTRPIDDCATAAPAVPNPAPDTSAAAAGTQASAQQQRPRASAQELPAAPPPPACEFKPVMSDEDVAACRKAIP
jgi:hypothetical protein